MTIAQLTSKIDKVKLYAAGATVTRIAPFSTVSGDAPDYVEIAGLPLALDDSSVRARVEMDGEAAVISIIAADIRIGLSVPERSEMPPAPADEEVRSARAEIQKLTDILALCDMEIAVLRNLEVPHRPKGEEGFAPPPSPTSARLALANFSDEQIRERIKEKREILEKIRKAKERLEELQQQQQRASSAREVREDELRKTAIVRLNYQGEAQAIAGQLIVEYFVPGARWTPTYVCRLDSAANRAAIAVRALICQRSGEDWAGVRLELSTAEPMAWCELPELPALRIGRAQSSPKKVGWRFPPIGADVLFEDCDRQKKEAFSAVIKNFIPTDLSVPEVPPLPDLKTEYEIALKAEEEEYSSDLELADDTPTEELAELLEIGWESDQFEELSLLLSQEKLETQALKKAQISDRKDEEEIYGRGISDIRSPEDVRKQVRYGVGDTSSEDSTTSLLAYNILRLGAADDSQKRGKLTIERQLETYLKILQRQKVSVSFDVMLLVRKAAEEALACLSVSLPPGSSKVRVMAGSFDYAYSADGRADVPSDGAFHAVALTASTTDADVRYVVVPREDTSVFRIAQLRNPLAAPLLAGSADVYVDGEYILSTNIATVPPLGQVELGLGVEQAIKVARNTFYKEERSGETLVAFNEFRHKIEINIANNLPREAQIEVRERIPIPRKGAKVDVEMASVSPEWEKYEQQERGEPIQGGYRWRVAVPAKSQTALSAQYAIKTFVDRDIMGGSRREE